MLPGFHPFGIKMAALHPGGDTPPMLGGSGGLGGLKPPPERPTLGGSFGRPKPSQANLSPLGAYLLGLHR